MPNRSQRHLRRIQGVDSGGRAPAQTPAKAAATATIAADLLATVA